MQLKEAIEQASTPDFRCWVVNFFKEKVENIRFDQILDLLRPNDLEYFYQHLYESIVKNE